MGTCPVKDNSIEIYLSVDKQFYVAGETVHGFANIWVKSPCHYKQLQLCLEGQEFISQPYSFRVKLCDRKFIIAVYHGEIMNGHYCHPFSFRIPENFPGSVIRYGNHALYYNLMIEMVHQKQRSKNQFYQIPLNIIENFQKPRKPIEINSFIKVKCCILPQCLSFFDCGETQIQFSSSKNCLEEDDEFEIEVMIDNKKGAPPVWKAELFLAKFCEFKVENRKKEAYELNCKLIHSFGSIESERCFIQSLKMKADRFGRDSTSSGPRTKLYYQYVLRVQYANLKAIFYTSKDPQIRRAPEKPLPDDWEPEIFPSSVVAMPHLNTHEGLRPQGPEIYESERSLMQNQENFEGKWKRPSINKDSPNKIRNQECNRQFIERDGQLIPYFNRMSEER